MSNPIVDREIELQKSWEANKIFEKTLAQEAPEGTFTFYDGPPFATGTPHYGHLVASVMKDVVPRYWTMKGYAVPRKWGWDCHGLPIENIVEKELGFKSKKDIVDFGVDKFNELCRSKVLGYVEEWKKTMGRFGRWADMENSYKTMDLDYMESVWWVFKELFDRGLIYEGYKSMHVCPRCETTLSQQEVSEGYKDIKDLSVTAKFELVDEPGTFVLAWTTTPWTLPANVALAVGEDVDYVEVEILDRAGSGKFNFNNGDPGKFVLAKNIFEKNYLHSESSLINIFNSGEKFIFTERSPRLSGNMANPGYWCRKIKEFKGSELVGKTYEPLFPYYKSEEAKAKLKNSQNLYTIVSADFVTTEDGTGVVHIAPAFGEDDMRLGQEKNLAFIQNVTMSGYFKDEVDDFKGFNVKPGEDTQKTDVEIIKYLAAKGLLFVKEKYEHSYPHCWRCDTPLINYATSSWFVKVTDVKVKALELAKEINWSPEHIKEGRFGKWLEGARDWSISRQRFWASVMPIWQCACGEQRVFGSVKELEEVSGAKITDLHKHHVDQIEFPCAKCGQMMKRIPDVLDTWFDSGSMPYAQKHYPFENVAEFEAGFPAQFIAEGVDQTRAWFYYLHIIATAIKDKRAYSNVIVNGIVLAEDGKKMSKRLQNYPEPEVVMEKYGADALRYYLLSSPVMAAENMNFSEASVKEAMQKVVMLTNNILNFYKTYEDKGVSSDISSVENVLDKWLIAKLNLLVKEVTKQMEAYDLPRSVRPIQEFIDEFSTWWLRRSRDRFKGEDEADKKQALATFKHALTELSKVMAPFTPFIADYLYKQVGGELESVHLEKWPEVKEVDQNVLDQMEQTRKIVELGLAARAEAGIKIRQPLAKAIITNFKLLTTSDEQLSALIGDELNVKVIEGLDGNNLKVELGTNITEELKVEGMLRELVRGINDIRKKQGLTVGDMVKLSWQSDGEVVNKVFADPQLSEELKKSVLAVELKQQEVEAEAIKLNGEMVKIAVEKI